MPWLALIILLFTSFPVVALAEEGQVLLVQGKILVENSEGGRLAPYAGQRLDSARHKLLVLDAQSSLILSQGEHIFRLQGPAELPLEKALHPQNNALERGLKFLAQLTSPKSYVSQNKIRGEAPEPNPDELFETAWQNIAQEPESKTTRLAEDLLLAAAAHFEQKGKKARVAYILERLRQKRSSNQALSLMRGQALERVSIQEINQEVKSTREKARLAMPKLRYRALLIGVQDYQNPDWQTLDNPLNDVRGLKRLLLEKYPFQAQDIILLENPSFDQIMAAFNRLKKEVTPEDHLLIYFAGHGYYPPDEGEGYWIPADGGNKDSFRLFIPTSSILSKVKAIKASHTLLVADSCFSGSLVGKSRGEENTSRFFRELTQKNSRQIITSGGLEPVADRGQGQHSVFASSLIRLLDQPRDEPWSASELALALRKDVLESGVNQTPEYGRLQGSGDEQGEFFFVQNQSQLPPAALPAAEPEPAFAWPEPDQKNPSSNAVGFGISVQVLQYSLPVQNSDSTSDLDKISVNSNLFGPYLKLEHKKRLGSLGYGPKLVLSQISNMESCVNQKGNMDTGISTCDQTDRDKAPAATSPVSGQAVYLGYLADYNYEHHSGFTAGAGGELGFQMLKLDRFLDQKNKNSNNLNSCVNSFAGYGKKTWFVHFNMDLCLVVFSLGGSLHQMEDQAEDLSLVANFKIGAAGGVKF